MQYVIPLDKLLVSFVKIKTTYVTASCKEVKSAIVNFNSSIITVTNVYKKKKKLTFFTALKKKSNISIFEIKNTDTL